MALLHDARNLFSAIGLYCDLLADPTRSCDQRLEYADELRMIAGRSREMLERWVQIAERKSGATLDQADSGTPVSLRAVAERCSAVLRQVAGGRAIQWSFGPWAAMPVLASEEAVERVLVNLVRNAAAALEERPGRAGGEECIRIAIGGFDCRFRSEGGRPVVALVVEDNGFGMNEQEVAALLTRNHGRGDGHGLGFQIVRSLVKQAGAEVKVLSKRGVGTRVTVDWRAAAPASAEGSSFLVEGERERVEKLLEGRRPC